MTDNEGLSLPRDPTYGNSVQDGIVTSRELCSLTDATYRQIDYWCRQGILEPAGKGTPGTGNRRMFNASLVDKVRLLVKISKAFERENSPLKRVAEHYEDGVIDLGAGIYLTWDVIEIERGL